jgi:F-type H+-transporting ATPase subunit gamma
VSQRREIEARLALFDDLAGILGAMRSFALAELHRVVRREEAQREVVEALKRSWHGVAPFLPMPAAPDRDIWLLLGSVRGFCGSYNEEVVRAWQAGAGERAATIVVGERLATVMPAGAPFEAVAGAQGGLDAAPAIDRILAALAKAREAGDGATFGLVVCLRDEEATRTERLLPLPAAPRGGEPPLMNEPPSKVAAGVAEHFLFHGLLAALLRAIRAENAMRLMQMENALRHLERGGEDLRLRRNRARQEEIVEEIELMTGGRAAVR